MGLNRIVTLFHSKLNTLGDNGRSSVSASSRNSGNDSTEDFDSSLSSSVESLMLPSPGIMCEAEGECGGATASPVHFPFARDVNNNDNNNNNSCCPPPANEFSPPFRRFQSISNSAQDSIRREFSTSDSFEDVLLVLGTEGSRAPACHAKRSSALSRRFSLKAKFSSDLDLYGKMNRMSMSEQQQDEVQQQQGSSSLGKHLKKSIWSSFRLPVRLIKGIKFRDIDSVEMLLKDAMWRPIIDQDRE